MSTSIAEAADLTRMRVVRTTLARGAGETASGEDPDIALVRRARRGDAEAFAELVRRYQDRLWGFLASWVPDAPDREELAQEVFLAAFRGIRRFRGEARFSTWLFQIAVNQARTYRRRAARSPRAVHIDALDEPLADAVVASAASDRNPRPDHTAAEAESRRLLWGLVGQLPPDWQASLRLRYVEGMTHPEIGAALGVPVGTVKVHLHRARERLATMLSAEDFE